jgi:RHS repeat-associated protein
MMMPNRHFESAGTGYRYGFNGKEKDKEINENSFTAEYWQYDARIGRRWNVDPVSKAYESPYAVLGNNPIWFIDFNGADTTKPEAAENGGKVKELQDVIVTSRIRTEIVNSFKQAVGASLVGHKDRAYLGDRLLNMIHDDPGFKSFQNDFIQEAKKDIRYGKEDFKVVPNQKMVTLGGESDQTPMSKQLKDFVNPFEKTMEKYPKTWDVASNELTWILRHVNVSPVLYVNSNGTFDIKYALRDKLDLVPNGQDPTYDAVVKVFGTVYHGILGGTPMQMHGDWRATIDKNGEVKSIKNYHKASSSSWFKKFDFLDLRTIIESVTSPIIL